MNTDMYDIAVGDLQKFLEPHSPDAIGANTDLLEQGVIDSLLMMDLVAHLEGTYGIRLAVEDIAPSQFRSISALASLIVKKLQTGKHASRVA